MVGLGTLGALVKSGYKSKTIKEELRSNLVNALRDGQNIFAGIHGYEKSVIPAVERAILSGHNINFLGLRGQAKTRIARMLTQLLDEYIPVLEGTDLNEDPLNPLSAKGKAIVARDGDATKISWLHRDERYAEKLATPDVSVADLIGDVDPIKAANLKLSYAYEEVIHFGMIPRANRCIFVINELPDLQARIQVALFNVLQEGDVQIRGFKLRLPLDIQFVFTANPEDYTNRGSIVTPLKDRIGSQILTHYPNDLATARKITAQEVQKIAEQDVVEVSDSALDLLEQIAFEARNNAYIDAKSGVSARLTISALENLLSTAERRALLQGAKKTSVRLLDFAGVIPAITGKVELVYEGEQEGAQIVAENLISAAAKSIMEMYFPPLNDLKRSNKNSAYTPLIEWFSNDNQLELFEDFSDLDFARVLNSVAPLNALVEKYAAKESTANKLFLKEVVLWGLAEGAKLNKEEIEGGLNFSDLFSSYLRGDEEP
jgi:magnesium chelatase subunit I